MTIVALVPDTVAGTRLRAACLAQSRWPASGVSCARVAGIGFAVLLMLVQLGFERGFFDASLGMVRQLDGELFVLRASKYRFGSEDPFPAATSMRRATSPASPPLCRSMPPGSALFWKDPAGSNVYVVQAFRRSIPIGRLLDPAEVKRTEQQAEADGRRARRPPRAAVSRHGRRAHETEINGRNVRDRRQLRARPRFHEQRHRDDEHPHLRDAAGRQCGRRAGAAGRIRRRQAAAGRRSGGGAAGLAGRAPRRGAGTDQAAARRLRARFQADLSSAGPIFWMGTVVGFVVGMLISYQIIYTDLSDQLPQYATLKGMGYGTGYLVRGRVRTGGVVGAWRLTCRPGCCASSLYPDRRRVCAAAAAHDLGPDRAQLCSDPGHVPDFRRPGGPPGVSGDPAEVF